jgi:excisionase family DNA binding protein
VELLTEGEAADYLTKRTRKSTSERTLRRYRLEGRIPYLQIGGSVRYDLAELDAFIEAGRRPAKVPAS